MTSFFVLISWTWTPLLTMFIKSFKVGWLHTKVEFLLINFSWRSSFLRRFCILVCWPLTRFLTYLTIDPLGRLQSWNLNVILNIYITYSWLLLFHLLQFINFLRLEFIHVWLSYIFGFFWYHSLPFSYTNYFLLWLWFIRLIFFGIILTIHISYFIFYLSLYLFTWFLLAVFCPGIFNFNNCIFLQIQFHFVKEIKVMNQVNHLLDFKMVLSDFISPNVFLNYCSWILSFIFYQTVHSSDPPGCFPTSLNHEHCFYFTTNDIPTILLESTIPPVSLYSAGSAGYSDDFKMGCDFFTQLIKL